MKILFLSTWFPYPLSQGSKIRAYHLLRALSERHQIALLSFQDDPVAPEWRDHLKKFCSHIEVIPRNPFATTQGKRIRGWFSLKPSSVVATYSPEMAERVLEIASDWHPDRIVALTFVTAPYALLAKSVAGNAVRVVDVDNLMAPMLRSAYQSARGTILRARNLLAWRKFYRFERQLFSGFDLCLAVTEQDRQQLDKLLKGRVKQIGVVANGVDTVHNQPANISPESNTLVYNGALTYSANYEAMEHFLSHILPLVTAEVPNVCLRITGKTEGVALDRLCMNKNVQLTGYLEDIRPTITSSWACVVPLLTGGGTRLKILESMALGTPVISTSKGAEGLDAIDGRHLLIADTPGRFAEQTIRLLRDAELRSRLALNARQLVASQFDWGIIRRHMCDLVERCDPHAKKTGA
jgi:glycosyltransferase involved in cell wall biosynthesis